MPGRAAMRQAAAPVGVTPRRSRAGDGTFAWHNDGGCGGGDNDDCVIVINMTFFLS